MSEACLDGVVPSAFSGHPAVSAIPPNVTSQQTCVRRGGSGEWQSARIAPVVAAWLAFYAIAIVGALSAPPPSGPAAVEAVAAKH